MNRRTFVASLSGGLALALWGKGTARGDELSPEVQACVTKALDYMAKVQIRDGSWEGHGGQYRTAMTGLAGQSVLMEGSTLREGKYSGTIRKCVDWYMEPGRVQRNGLIGNPNNPGDAARYMYGHGFSLLFLSSVYGEEEDNDRRKKLEDILTRAVQFCCKAQHANGGWGYISAADGDRFDEGSVTITQVQALRAARNAGIAVPKEAIDKARKYLETCTTERGGVMYRPGMQGERLPITVAAVACMFNAGEYDAPIVKKWLKYIQGARLNLGGERLGHDEYMQYYYAQCMYMLGEDGYVKQIPESKDKPDSQLRWSKYKKENFDVIIKGQANDGSWSGSGRWGHIGPVYATSIYLTVLQLENATLPIYQR